MDLVHTLAVSEGEVFTIFVIGGVIFGIVATLAATVQKVLQTKQQEQTRREVAAYVAEGSISPDDAVRILGSGRSLKDRLKETLGA